MGKVLLVGAGYMAKEYCKVLKGLDKDFVVIGNRQDNVEKLKSETGISAITGGLENNMDVVDQNVTHAIVAVPFNALFYITRILVERGIKSILVEKPAGRDSAEVCTLSEMAERYGADIYVAYNRRFYASVSKALEMIENNEEKILSVDFEFTEWIDRIYEAHKNDKEVANIFFSNSTHVVDLAYFFSGLPKDLSCYSVGNFEWSNNKTQYAGAGISDRDVLISYRANWEAPGRWGLDVITDEHRYRFCPLEELKVQNKNSVVFENIDLDNQYEQAYKPGLYCMVRAFLEKDENMDRLLSIAEFKKNVSVYEKMEH